MQRASAFPERPGTGNILDGLFVETIEQFAQNTQLLIQGISAWSTLGLPARNAATRAFLTRHVNARSIRAIGTITNPTLPRASPATAVQGIQRRSTALVKPGALSTSVPSRSNAIPELPAIYP